MKKFVSVCIMFVASTMFNIESYANQNTNSNDQSTTIFSAIAQNSAPYTLKAEAGEFCFENDIDDILFSKSNYDVHYMARNINADNVDEFANTEITIYGWQPISVKSEHWDLTDSICEYNWSFFTSKSANITINSISDLKSKTIGVRNHDIPIKLLYDKGITDIKIYQKSGDLYSALSGGEVDVIFDDYLAFKYFCNINNTNELFKSYPELSEKTPVAIAVKKGNDQLVKFLNKRIQLIKSNGVYEIFYKKYFNESPNFENNTSMNRNLFVLFSILGVSLCAIALVYLYARAKYKGRLKNEQQFSDLILENADICIFIWDRNLKILRINDYIERITGVPAHTYLDSSIRSFLNTIDFDTLNSNAKHGKGIHDTINIVTPDNNIITMVFKSSLFKEGKSPESNEYLSVGVDITEVAKLRDELKAQTDQLRASEVRYEQATAMGEIGISRYDPSIDKIYISKIGAKLLGYNDQLEMNRGEWLDMVHPEDYKLYRMNEEIVTGNIKSDGYSPEIRLKCKDGSYKWFMYKFGSIWDSENQVAAITGTFVNIHSMKQKIEASIELAFIDSVTGLYNSRKLFIEGEKMCSSCIANGLAFAAFYMDINSFKLVNSYKGTSVGDKLLKKFTSIITRSFPKSSMLFRMKSDEFVVLCPVKDKSKGIIEIQKYIEKFDDMISQLDGVIYGLNRITTTTGVVMFPEHGSNWEEILERADMTHKSAKSEGQTNIKFFNASIGESLAIKERLRSDLQNGTVYEGLEIYLQPKMAINPEHLYGAEVLVRWNHAELGTVSPGLFVPLAEEMGIIQELDQWVLEATCAQITKWDKEGFDPIIVSVNLSSIALRDDNLVQNIVTTLTKFNVAPSRMDFELTESYAMDNIDLAIVKMQEILDIGSSLSIDDFGTGHSSLSYLQNFPVKYLKIDRSFIVDVEFNTNSQIIVLTLIRLAKSLGLQVVAEGVETEQQKNFLLTCECDYIQGYFYSKPVPVSKFESFMTKAKP